MITEIDENGMKWFSSEKEHTWFTIKIIDEDKVPTIHCEDEYGYKFSVRLDKAEYVNNLEGEKPMHVGDCQLLQHYFESRDERYYCGGETAWEWLRGYWNLNHSENIMPKMKMPNYNELDRYNIDLQEIGEEWEGD